MDSLQVGNSLSGKCACYTGPAQPHSVGAAHCWHCETGFYCALLTLENFEILQLILLAHPWKVPRWQVGCS